MNRPAIVTRAPRDGGALALAAGGLGLFALSCSTTTPVPRRFHFETVPLAPPTAPLGRTLRVEPFEAVSHLGGDRLRARVSPIEIEEYEGQRWAAPLERMVPEALATSLERSGVLRRASFGRGESGEDWVLAGEILSFHEEDRPDGWWGVVALRLRLEDARSGGVLWAGLLTAERRAKARNPARVVEALREALGDALAEAVGEWQAIDARAPRGSSDPAPGIEPIGRGRADDPGAPAAFGEGREPQ